MSITLNGITSEGTSVPIEVTADGKLVVDTSGLQGFIKQGDDINAGDITAGVVQIGDGSGPDKTGVRFNPAGWMYMTRDGLNGDVFARYYRKDTGAEVITFEADGKISATSLTASSNITAGTLSPTVDNENGIEVGANGVLSIQRQSNNASASSLEIYSGGLSQATFQVRGNGAVSAASGNCGFTSSGELYFWSRNVRYKAVVQGGNVMAEEFTRAAELQEKAAQLRENAEDLKEPRTQDIVPED